MKEYVRLFLSLIFVIFILNRVQAKTPESITQVEVPNAVQTEVPEGIAQEEVSEGIAQEEVSEGIAQEEVPEGIVQEEVPEGIAQEEVPEGIAQEEVSEGMIQKETSNRDQTEIPEEILQVHKAVWKLVKSGKIGTAFFIGPNQVVTNFHVIVIGQGESYKNHSIKEMYLKQGAKRLNFNKVLYVSAVDDLAILETEEEVSDYLNVSEEKSSRNLLDIYYPKGLLISPMIRNLGRLFALGYPEGVKRTLIHSEKYEVVDSDNDYEISVNQVGLQGLSGGPVLNEKKEVIGVVHRARDNMLYVKKVSQLEKQRRAFIGLDCSDIPLLSSCIEREIQNLREKVEQKDPLAQFVLADMYYIGRGVKKNKKEELKWVLESARRGHAFARYYLAIKYLIGEGVEKDEKEAFDWMLKVANQGYALAQAMLGEMYITGAGVKEEDKEEAFKRWLKAARQGHVMIQYNLAQMYLYGIVVDKAEEEAFYWMLESAKQDFALAQETIIQMYHNGIGVTDDNKEAFFNWFLEKYLIQSIPNM